MTRKMVRLYDSVYTAVAKEATKNNFLSTTAFVNHTLAATFGVHGVVSDATSEGAKSESLGKVYTKEELDENIF